MCYPKEFLEIQYKFAEKVAALKNISLEEALLEYTNLYKIFGVEDWDFDANNQIWVDFISAIKDSEDPMNFLHEFYLLNRTIEDENPFGCFSYEFDPETNKVSIHFGNNDDPEPGALSKSRMQVRIQELRDMFIEIKGKFGENIRVYGHSWLYNLEAYKRLFPPEYVSNFSIDPNCFKGIGQWAQFLNSYGEVKQDMYETFLENLENLNDISEIEDCFPFRVLHGYGDVKFFYELYGINSEFKIK